MIILGIDPGTQIMGYGLIEKTCRTSFLPIDYGCIRPPKQLPLPERYCILFEGLETLIDQYKPDVLAIESQFVLKNVQSALKLGMAKGMALLAAARQKMQVYEYTPTRIKSSVTGSGRAGKGQVQYGVQAILRLAALPEPEDAADALAAAICHAQLGVSFV